MLKKDYLPNHPEIELYQDDKMFRINSDTTCLGEFIEVYKNDVVLDMGTNTGGLLLYINRFHPKKMIGLDINSEALEIAKKNIELNNITNCELICDNIVTYKGPEVDVIVCNPPYFNTPNNDKGLNKYKALAKHEGDLNLDNLIASLRRNLKNNGTLYMLFLTSRLAEVMHLLKQNKFRVKKLQFVYDENKEYSNVFMLKAVKGKSEGMVVLKPVIITRKGIN